MSFKRPERLLTEEEWTILADAAQDKAGDYNLISSALVDQKYLKRANFFAKRANKIYDILIRIENEYYEAHPEEAPDKKEKSNEVLH